MSEGRPPFPPFTRETAMQKVRAAEDGWNSCDPQRVSLVYTPDSEWRNRVEFFRGRAEIVAFLTRKWAKELDYRLIKELWAFTDNRIAVRFAYEWHDDSGNWLAPMATRIGNSPAMALCSGASPASMILRSTRPSGNFTGTAPARGQPIIPACPIWDCSGERRVG
jgi:nuclear transport factor 2 (NTF2) superfamily protein